MKTRTILTILIALLSGIALTLAAADPGVESSRSIDAAERGRILRSVSTQLRQGYIYEEKGNRFAKSIAKAAKVDRFAEHEELGSFVAGVNLYLLELSDDRHLRLRFGSGEPHGTGPRRVVRQAPPGEVRGAPGHGSDHSGGSDHGIREAKVLDGNIGYLDLRRFAGSDSAKEAIDAAMLTLEDTEALIIDLGRNGGGGPWMVRYLSGFLFAEPTHLTDTWMRGMEEPRQRWTLPGQPTEAFHDKPVYLLTSKKTFSAAESFTFGLTINDRVTVIGERTGGGGHFGDTVPVAEDLRLFVPRGRTYDPETGDGWEAAGIEPDVPVDYAGALTRALSNAGKAIARASIQMARSFNALFAG